MAASPTSRSLEHLRKAGYRAEVVERFNQFSKTRKDLFGILDIVALSPEGQTYGVQSTSLTNVSARIRKITDSDALFHLRLCGWRIVVHGWGKGSNGRYRIREVVVS